MTQLPPLVTWQYVPPLVTRIEPVLGALEGGTRVQIHGSGFSLGGGLSCQFGHEVVPVTAVWLSDTQLECRSRARDRAGNATLEVSISGEKLLPTTELAMSGTVSLSATV